MKYSIQLYTEGPKRVIEPLAGSFTIDCPSPDAARQMLVTLTTHRRAHSVTIRSEDGSVAERWFQLDGEWRRKPLKQPGASIRVARCSTDGAAPRQDSSPAIAGFGENGLDLGVKGRIPPRAPHVDL